jgi:hypothetical protein
MKPIGKVARLPESEIVARVIKNFVVKHRRARYLAMAEKPNKWGGYGFGELAHFTHNLDFTFCKQMPTGSQDVKYVLDEISRLTQTRECYIMNENKELDGKWMALEEALNSILGSNLGAIVIVDNGDIIYHESENIKHRYIGIRRQLPLA